MFLTVGDVARLIGKGSQRVRQLEQQGVLRAIRTSSGVRLFTQEEVEKYLAERKPATQLLTNRNPLSKMMQGKKH